MKDNVKEYAQIFKISSSLITVINNELTDKGIMELQEEILKMFEKEKCRSLLIDVSALEYIDTFTARVIMNTAKMAYLIGAKKTIVTGIKPEIAITLVQMGFRWKGVETALSIEDGLNKLRI